MRNNLVEIASKIRIPMYIYGTIIQCLQNYLNAF